MTQDPYRLDDEDLPLAADSLDAGDDDYDGLELENAAGAKPKSKLPLLLALVAIVAAVGGYFVYQTFVASDDASDQPQAIQIAAPENAPVQPTPDAVAQDLVAQQAAPDAAPADTANPVALADPNATLPSAVTADAVPAPAASDTPDAPATPSETAAAMSVPVESPATAAADAAAQLAPAPLVPETPAATAPAQAAAVMPEPPKEQLTPVEAKPVPMEPGQKLAGLDPMAKTLENSAAAKMNAQKDAMNEVNGQASNQAMPASLPVSPNADPAMVKTAQTMQAVNDILGGAQGLPMPNATGEIMAKQVEVTSRASQVIIVKKNYSAQSSQAINAAGERVLDAGQYGAAADLYKQQLKKNPSDPSALAGSAMALQKTGRTTEAMDAYQRLIELNPRDVEALTNYMGLLQKQNPEEALIRLNGLAEQYPDNAAVMGQLGMVHASMLDTPQAIQFFRKAMALDANNPTYPFNLAVLYDRLGTNDKAYDAYRMALNVAGDYPNRAEGIPLDVIRTRLSALH